MAPALLAPLLLALLLLQLLPLLLYLVDLPLPLPLPMPLWLLLDLPLLPPLLLLPLLASQQRALGTQLLPSLQVLCLPRLLLLLSCCTFCCSVRRCIPLALLPFLRSHSLQQPIKCIILCPRLRFSLRMLHC